MHETNYDLSYGGVGARHTCHSGRIGPIRRTQSYHNDARFGLIIDSDYNSFDKTDDLVCISALGLRTGVQKTPYFALWIALHWIIVENGQQPTGNFYQGGQPDSPKSQQYGFRLDFTPSATDRFFFRTSGITFLEYVSDWTYLAEPDLRIHSADRSRYQWSYTGTWTRR